MVVVVEVVVVVVGGAGGAALADFAENFPKGSRAWILSDPGLATSTPSAAVRVTLVAEPGSVLRATPFTNT